MPNYDTASHIRRITNRSWVNLHAAARALQGKSHAPFGTAGVERSSKSVVGRIRSEAGLSLAEIEVWAERQGR